MKIALFYHSLYSDWNHGNAHFLRGISRELIRKGHKVLIYESEDGWSLENLIKDHGKKPIGEFKRYFPGMASRFYNLSSFDFKKELDGIDLAIVHEWNEPDLIEALGAIKDDMGFALLFHDTHHRAVSDPDFFLKLNLAKYDGALVFGEVLRGIYLERKWTKRVWTWHEAADTNIFKPMAHSSIKGDLVWIGNWGDNERTEELMEFLIRPVIDLKLRAKVYGVRYPQNAIRALADAGIDYGGWLPNYKAPEVFSGYRATIHVPRRPYARLLPGIPTIRPF